MSRESHAPSPISTIFRKEIRELLRDRRAVFFAFVLPLFLYPLIFFGMTTLSKSHRDDLESKELTVGVSGLAGVRLRFPEHVLEEDHLRVIEADPDEDGLRNEAVAAFLVLEETDHGSINATVHYLHAVPSSREGRTRVDRVCERLEKTLLEEKFASLGREISLDRLVRVEEKDISLAVERSAVGLGKFLPALLMFLLMTGGAFASIDLVAGEKERGTLETLYIQSISAGQIAMGKFLVVLVTSLTSVLFNLAGLGISAASGLIPTSLGADSFLVPPAGNLVIVLMLLVPFSVLTSAILLAVSAYARSYREAQTYLLPLMLVILIPVGLAAAPQIELSSIVSVVPVANVALATREAVEGKLQVLPMLLVLVSTCVYAGLMLRVATDLLKKEEVVVAIEASPLATDASEDGRRRRALAFGAVFLLWVYFAANWLQGSGHFGLLSGLALTLWGAVLVPALLYPLITRQPFAPALGLRRPSLSSLLLVLPMAVACSLVMGWYASVQDIFLPLPEEARQLYESMEATFEEQGAPTILVLFVFAISPGVCEEMFWRGAFQGDVAAGGRRWKTILTVGFFFGVFHFSSYRFVPTAVLGGVLAVIRMRSASLFPCIVFHAAYNAVTFFGLSRLEKPEGADYRWLLTPWSAMLATLGVVLCLRGLRPPRHRV